MLHNNYKAKTIKWDNINVKVVYSYVLHEEIKRFPPHYMNRERSIEIMRYVFLEKNNFTREEIVNIDIDVLADKKLSVILKRVFKSTFEMISTCFPEMEIYEWELKHVPDNFWSIEENRTKYVKWIFQKFSFSCDSKQDLRKINSRIIASKFGSRALKEAGGIYNLLNPVINGKYKEWEITKIPVWTDELKKQAIKWLLEEILGFTDSEIVKWKIDDIRENVHLKEFKENDLGGMLKKCFSNNIVETISFAYKAIL